jgi:nucleotide-binding universal stress UspA family protein
MVESAEQGFRAAPEGPLVIVVGVDATEIGREGPTPSVHAAEYVAGLARRLDARLVGVWVRPPVAYGDQFAQTAEMIASSRQETEAELREAASRADEYYGLPPGCILVRDGDPTDELTRVAEEVHADGIVVGASEHRLGSVAARLIRNGRWPVTVVPPPNRSDG